MATFKKLPKDPSKPDGPARAWRVQVTISNTPRKILTRTFKTKAECESWAAEQRVDADDGSVVEPSKEQVSTYLRRWIETKRAQKVSARTIAGYEQMLGRYVFNPVPGSPAIGPIRMDQLRPARIQKLYNFLLNDRGLSVRTVRLLHSILHQAFDYAVEDKILRNNPTPSRKRLPKRERKEIRAMNETEARRFLKAARGDPHQALWVVLLTTGCRPSEALALQWRDLEGDRLTVQRSLNRRGVKTWELNPPKTDNGKRTLTLSPLALEALSEHRRRQAEERLKAGPEYADHPGGGFIFADPKGEPLEQTGLYRRNFKRILHAAELGSWKGEGKGRRFESPFTMYSLRHSAASLALKSGINPKVTAALLGHADTSITLNVYSHLLGGEQAEVADRMQSLLGEAAPVEDLPATLRALADRISREKLDPEIAESLSRLVTGFLRTHSLSEIANRGKETG